MSYKKNVNLENSKVFLLGAGQIGSKILDYFNEFDSQVVVVDKKRPENLLDKNFFYEFDLAQVNKIAELFDELIKKHDCPEILINSSYPKNNNWANCDFENSTTEDFLENLNFHLGSFSISSKIICDEMKKNDLKGSVVLLNSIYGLVAQDENLYVKENINMSFPYPVIKSGIGGLTQQLSSYYGKYGIRVNSICSGGIQGKVSGADEKMNTSFANKYITKVPLGRMATSDDIANMACFLSSKASSYITGQNIAVDGGYTAK